MLCSAVAEAIVSCLQQKFTQSSVEHLGLGIGSDGLYCFDRYRSWVSDRVIVSLNKTKMQWWSLSADAERRVWTPLSFLQLPRNTFLTWVNSNLDRSQSLKVWSLRWNVFVFFHQNITVSLKLTASLKRHKRRSKKKEEQLLPPWSPAPSQPPTHTQHLCVQCQSAAADRWHAVPPQH